MYLWFSWSVAAAQDAGALRVCTWDGERPLPGAALSIRRQAREALVYEGITGDDGCATLELPRGRWKVVAERDGFSTVALDSVPVQPGRLTEHRLRLSRPTVGCDAEPAWGSERERGALRLAYTPLERGAASAWTRGEAWLGMPASVALGEAVVAGPAERVPALPQPAQRGLSVRRGRGLLGAPGGQLVVMQPELEARDSLLSWAGPSPHGLARLGPTQAREHAGAVSIELGAPGRSLEQGPMPASAAATARLEGSGRRLGLLALGSLDGGSDGLMMAEAEISRVPGLTLRSTALARRWAADGLLVDRWSLGSQVSWSRWLALGALVERHGVVSGSSVERASGALDLALPVTPGLQLRTGARAWHERMDQADRAQLAPRVELSLRERRLGLELLGAVFDEPAIWMPEGVGVALPFTRTYRLELAHRLWSWGEAWGGLRRTDLPQTREAGALLAVGGLAWARGKLAARLDGALATSLRWSSATAEASYGGERGPRLGLISAWRSGPGNAPPPGMVTALPFTEAAHLDAGSRLGLPFALRGQTLVMEGSLWGRLLDPRDQEAAFSPRLAASVGEVSARFEW